jgi:hypothetical protein
MIMKHIKTFEGFVNEGYKSNVNEGEDTEGFIEALKAEVEKAGGYLHVDMQDPDVFALTKSYLSVDEIDTMFDSGKPVKDAIMFNLEDGLLDAEKSITAGVKKLGLNVNVKRLVQIYESAINEGVGDAIARDYEALIMSDVDFDDIYIGDDALDLLDKTLKSNKYGDNSKVYMTNKTFVEDSGKDWNALIQLIKSKNLKYDVIEDPEEGDAIVLFSR